MSPENRQRLEKYRPKYNSWINDKFLDLKTNERAEIIGIIRQEWLPGYVVMEWCGSCVASMIELAFRQMDSEPKEVKKKK